METVSKKRGRPRKYDPAEVAAVVDAGGWYAQQTPRHKQSRYIATEAIGLLMNEEQNGFIEGVERVTDSTTICEQLGRLSLNGWPAEEIIKLARTINAQLIARQVTVRRVVGVLRRARLQEGE